MSNKPVPIYGKSDNGKGYTVYFDINTNKVYRGNHKELHSPKYWLVFFTFLVLMRGLAELSFGDSWFIKLILIIIGVPISIFIGKIIQRRSIEDLREIYLSDYTLEEYMNRGKNMMLKEMVLMIIILIIAITLSILFIISNWLIWLAFSFLSFAIAGMMFNGISLRRWNLYKNGL